MKKEHYFQSSDEKTSLHAIVWEPEGSVKAVLQITHGMVEFIDRYDRFARMLNEHGFCVCGFDLLGHGLSVTSEEELGFFRHPDGNRAVIEDIRHLQCIMKRRYPDVPYFILGHSMGSFYVRQFIEKFGNFSVSVIKREYAPALLGNFGFQSGRDIDKFAKYDCIYGQNTGVPIVTEECLAWFECKLTNKMDVGSHILYIGEVLDALRPFGYTASPVSGMNGSARECTGKAEVSLQELASEKERLRKALEAYIE